jgi:hypothetical protein
MASAAEIRAVAATEAPDWIDSGEEPEGFSTACPLNQGRNMSRVYYWNSPCARLNQKAGWSIGIGRTLGAVLLY